MKFTNAMGMPQKGRFLRGIHGLSITSFSTVRSRYESSCKLGNRLRQRIKFSWHIGCEPIYQDESDSVSLVIAQEGGQAR
jgi:hypothetical protein